MLKGASASAIYGSKASAGVVIITTKKGTAGKPAWSFAQNVGHFSDAQTDPIRNFPTLGECAGVVRQRHQRRCRRWRPSRQTTRSSPVSMRGPQDYQTTVFGNGQASYETDLSVSGTSGPTQYFLSGLSKYDNGTLLNSGYNKQSIRTNVTEQFSSPISRRRPTSSTPTRWPARHLGQRQQRQQPVRRVLVHAAVREPEPPERRRELGAQSVRTGESVRGRVDISTPETTQRFIGGGQSNWTPYSTEHQSLQVTLIGGVDLATCAATELYAPSNLQLEQTPAAARVSRRRRRRQPIHQLLRST